MPTAHQRSLGAYYTPEHITTHMVNQLFNITPTSTILEPSGGDGAFITALLNHPTHNIKPHQITVHDINPNVANTITSHGVTFTHTDTLLPEHPPTPAPTHIIGNPPYLNKHSHYIRTHRTQLAHTYKNIGANDTYAMFTYRALADLAPGGQLIYLLSDTWLTLATHTRLRAHLLTHTITSITLLPDDTFGDANVRTCILNITKTPPPPEHTIAIHNHRHTPATTIHIDQTTIINHPRHVIAHTPETINALAVAANCPTRLYDHLDGGLGLHTGDNATYLQLITDTTDHTTINGTDWRYYHKTGGRQRWYAPVDHAIKWDPTSQQHYGIPASALAGTTADGHDRPGILISGISSQLTARRATKNALWESNKAFIVFPKNPDTHPPEFFTAILNSNWYTTYAHAINHTVSLQTRDIKQLPLLPFTDDEIRRLATLGAEAIADTRDGHTGEPAATTTINTIVNAAAARAARPTETN